MLMYCQCTVNANVLYANVLSLMNSVYNCSLCDFTVPTKPMLLSHIRLIHSNDPQFVVTCGIDGCVYTAKRFSTYYSHIYRKYPNSGYISRKTSEIERLVSPEHEHLPDNLFTQYNEGIGQLTIHYVYIYIYIYMYNIICGFFQGV